MNSDFQPPPLGWSILSIAGGIATAAGIIISLEVYSASRKQTESTQTTQPPALQQSRPKHLDYSQKEQ